MGFLKKLFGPKENSPNNPPMDLPDGVILALDRVIAEAQKVSDLTPQELAVMEKVIGHTVGKSRDYWLEKAGVDVNIAADHYLAHEYATYAPLDPWDKTVAELKDMLRAKGAKVSGPKEDLVDRVWETYDENELIKLNPVKRLKYTEKGFDVSQTVPYTVLWNYVLERKCLELIAQGRFEDAREQIVDYRKANRINATTHPVNADRFARLQRMKGFSDPVKDTIYNAMQILAYLATGSDQTPMIYIESWIDGYHGTDKTANDRIDAEYIRVMKQ